MGMMNKMLSFINFLNEQKNEGVFVGVKPTNKTASLFHTHFKNQDISEDLLVPKNELHTTVIFSRTYIPYEATEFTRPIVIDPETYKITRLGPTAVVLKFESEELQQMHQKGMNMGATYDFDSYIPHMTITYEGEALTDEFIESLIPPKFPLEFDREYVEPLDLSRLSN